MRVTLWGTRGSLASPGPETARYGGNTSCVEVCGPDGTRLVLDAGTGIRRLGMALPTTLPRVDLLLTHLHLDHLQGLGFFAPLFVPDLEVHLWGPASTTLSLAARLMRYLSPPLFPLRLRDLPCRLTLHEVPCGDFEIGPFRIAADLVCHPGPTVGYRIALGDTVLTYLPDHEPALGVEHFPLSGEWTSGYALAAGADLLIHDAQYSPEEYADYAGRGHSSIRHALTFAALAEVKHLLLFHYDPAYTDDALDQTVAALVAETQPAFVVTAAREGETLQLDGQ
jgi:ribonuclease BN (tRNA processing enzyme)